MKTQKNKSLLACVLILIAVSMVVVIGCFTESAVEDNNDIPAVNQEVEQDQSDIEETEVVLTIETSKEFEDVIASDGDDNTLYLNFANKYEGQIVEFDAHIDLVAKHEDYNTRYDILLSSGDWINENFVSPGPLFQIENVNTYDLGIDDLYLPDWVEVGSNIKVTAEIDEFDDVAGVMILDPIKVEKR